MGKNYYQVLNCRADASHLDIAANFRVLALHLHPEKNKGPNFAQATFAFSEVCEAFEVLSTPELKEIYDKFGEDILKNGLPHNKLGFKGGYKFLGNTQEIFEKFFGTANPHVVQLDEHSQQMGVMQSKGSLMDAFTKRFSNLTVTASCTLEEFYYGCQKTINFERLVLLPDGKRQKMEVVKKIIHVKPGMGSHTQLTFSGEGHNRPGQAPSDLVVTFKQKPHDKFERVGNDLVLNHKISLEDALSAGPVHFRTIEDELVEVSMDQVISPESFKVLEGRGMPVLNDSPLGAIKRDYARGNLILKFDIQFP